MPSNSNVVSSYYNSLKETGLKAKNDSYILFLRIFYNWIKSNLIQNYASETIRDFNDINVHDLGSDQSGEFTSNRWNPTEHYALVETRESKRKLLKASTMWHGIHLGLPMFSSRISMSGGNKNQTHLVKKSIHTAYHFGCGVAILGLVILLIGVSIHSVFELFIFDQRQSPTFHQVKIKMGLFGNTALLVDQLGNVNSLRKPLELTDSRWHAAKLMAIIGILTIIAAIPIHIATSSFLKRWRKWWIILLELSLLFVSVICILICLSLAESEIELIHDSDDFDLKTMLHRNGLMIIQKETMKSTYPNKFSGNWELKKIDLNAQQYNLVLSPPKLSYYLFIASEFCTLLSFLCTLVFFIRISDLDEKDKALLHRGQDAPSYEA